MQKIKRRSFFKKNKEEEVKQTTKHSHLQYLHESISNIELKNKIKERKKN